MARFATRYQLTGATLVENSVRVLTCSDEKNITAFFNIKAAGNTARLEHFYVRRDLIGCGVGRKLWKHLVVMCQEKGFKTLEGITYPKALPFYLKMGAIQTGLVRSSLNPDQQIPKFKFDLAGHG